MREAISVTRIISGGQIPATKQQSREKKTYRSREEWQQILCEATLRGIGVKELASEIGIPVSSVEKAQQRIGVYLGRGRPPRGQKTENPAVYRILLGKQGGTPGESGFALVDEQDVAQLEVFWWRVDTNGYAYRNEGTAGKNLRHVLMHREILRVSQGVQVDHINRNRLDNRRVNLRAADAGQQADNAGLRKDNTTGYKGVVTTRSGRWGAQLQHRGKSYWVGTYDTAEEASEAHASTLYALKGEFAHPARK